MKDILDASTDCRCNWNNLHEDFCREKGMKLLGKTILETGIPVVRNKDAGHGQGSTVPPISDEFAEYALNLAETNIVLLVGIYKRFLFR